MSATALNAGTILPRGEVLPQVSMLLCVPVENWQVQHVKLAAQVLQITGCDSLAELFGLRDTGPVPVVTGSKTVLNSLGAGALSAEGLTLILGLAPERIHAQQWGALVSALNSFLWGGGKQLGGVGAAMNEGTLIIGPVSTYLRSLTRESFDEIEAEVRRDRERRNQGQRGDGPVDDAAVSADVAKAQRAVARRKAEEAERDRQAAKTRLERLKSHLRAGSYQGHIEECETCLRAVFSDNPDAMCPAGQHYSL